MDFNELLAEAHLSPRKAAQYLNLHPRTIQRYIAKGRAPRPVELALQWLAGTHPQWLGWRIIGDQIQRPHGRTLHKNELDQLEWINQIQFMRGMHFSVQKYEDEKPAIPSAHKAQHSERHRLG